MIIDKELQLWIETEQDWIQGNSKNRSYNISINQALIVYSSTIKISNYKEVHLLLWHILSITFVIVNRQRKEAFLCSV